MSEIYDVVVCQENRFIWLKHGGRFQGENSENAVIDGKALFAFCEEISEIVLAKYIDATRFPPDPTQQVEQDATPTQEALDFLEALQLRASWYNAELKTVIFEPSQLAAAIRALIPTSEGDTKC